MPFVLILVGLLIVIAGFQNTYKELGTQLASDFTGQNNFTWYLVSIFVVGAIGYAGGKNSSLQNFSRAFMALIIVAMVLANSKAGNNFFDALTKQIQAGTNLTPDTIGAPLTGEGGRGGDGGGFGLGDAIGIASGLGF